MDNKTTSLEYEELSSTTTVNDFYPRKTRQGTIAISGSYNLAKRRSFECSQAAPSSAEYDLNPRKADQETVIKLHRPTGNLNETRESMGYDRVAANEPNDFYSWAAGQEGTVDSYGSSWKSDNNFVRKATTNFSKRPSAFGGENGFSDAQGSLQSRNENSCPTQKRSRWELLSLFGGKSRDTPDEQKQDPPSNEAVAPLEQNLSAIRDSRNISHDEMFPKTNNLFSETFDISLGDGDDFSESSFENLNNPGTNYNTTTHMTPRLDRPPHWKYADAGFRAAESVGDEYIDPEIEKVLDYDDDTNNYATSLTSSQSGNLPWKYEESRVSKDYSILDAKHFNEELDFNDNGSDESGMFDTSSKTRHGMECKYQNFCNPQNSSIIRNNFPASNSNEPQVDVSSNGFVNQHVDLGFGDVLYDNEDRMFDASSGRSRSVVLVPDTVCDIGRCDNGNTHPVTVSVCKSHQ